jgi:GTP-binding protein Era
VTLAQTPRAGIVAVVGRPNVGKSTLVNALVDRKVAIVSEVPQTTRRDIRAIWNGPDVQVVYTDTPGFHKPRTLLGTRLNDLVGQAVEGVDVVLHVVDAHAGVGRGDAFVYAEHVRPTDAAAMCVVNKIDLVHAHREVPELAAAAELGPYDEIVPVSAKAGTGIERLRGLVIERLPEGPPLYPPDEVTDQPLEVQLAEIIREKALSVTHEEVPHSIAVVIEELDDDAGLTRVHAGMIVERDSQKGIVIGKGGRTLTTIGSAARKEMEALLGTKVYLDLRVKVLKEWQRDPRALQRLGF